jgi:alpha-D-xyloside xylohydrolase
VQENTVANVPAFQKAQSSITVRTADGWTVELDAFSDKVIGVRASKLAALPKNDSFMIVPENRQEVKISTGKTENGWKLSTGAVTAKVDASTGAVTFLGKRGKTLLREVPGSRTMAETVEMGEKTFRVGQHFYYDKVNVLMGLGNHQDGIANYKGRDCALIQYNCIDIIPFFVTDAGYGMLWDNDSITHFGDPRVHQDLGKVFKLYDEEGREGGLTARYFGDSMYAYTMCRRLEQGCQYQFNPDKKNAPEGFNFDKGSIRWEGFIEAKEDGVHKMRSFGSHYIKVTVDDVVYVDKWRQNWMPWQNLFDLDLKKGEKHKIVIEWNCNGGYCAMEALSPADPRYSSEIAWESEVGEQVRYYFVAGETADEQIAGYRLLTGKASMMPRWTMGFWQCRERYETQAQLTEVVAEFRKRNMPLDCIVQDWQFWGPDGWGTQDFDPSRFPDPRGMIADLHEKYNAHLLISVWAKFNKHTPQFKELYEKGWIYKKQPDTDDKDWLGYPYGFYDAFNEQAGRWVWNLVNEKLYRGGAVDGADSWWLDATEPDIVSNMDIANRKEQMNPTAKGTSARVYNAFSINHCRWFYEGQRAASENKRVVILTRSSYPGHQRYGAATWSGDVASRWEDLKKQITCGLNFCAAGIPYWTTDIGGFAVEPRYEKAIGRDVEEFRELNMRWYQFGVFNPLFRVHGQFPCREVFRLCPEDHPVYKAMVEYNRLRYRLMPWLYSLSAAVTLDDSTMMRPLFMDFAHDAKVRDVADEFMFGSILVAPVTDFLARSRKVYLPKGADWYNFHTGELIKGGRTIVADAPLTEIPLFVKAGTILPMGGDIAYADENAGGPLQIRVYPGADATFTLYEDEGDNYNCENGAYARTVLSWNDAAKTLTLSGRDGSFPGMAETRAVTVVLANGSRGAGKALEAAPDASLTLSDESASVTLK